MKTAARVLLAILALGAVTVGVAACGGKGSNHSSASHMTQQQRLVAAMDAFARCARAHGIPVPDAAPNGQIPGADALKRKYVNTPQGQAVLRDCQRQLNAAQQLSDAANTADRQGALRFARCMRAHGIPVSDPSPSGTLTARPEKISKSSPQVRAAAADCGPLLGNPGKGR
jgi:hypothetical protein